MRNPNWNQDRPFKRGEVFFVDLPAEPHTPPDPSRVLNGAHRCVVLFDSEFPRKTVTVLPITSLYNSQNRQKKVVPTDVMLSAEDYRITGSPYRGVIEKDSIIRTEQIRSISRHLLERKVGQILPKDMTKIDVALILSLGLQETINHFIQYEVEKRLGSIDRQNRNNRRELER